MTVITTILVVYEWIIQTITFLISKPCIGSTAGHSPDLYLWLLTTAISARIIKHFKIFISSPIFLVFSSFSLNCSRLLSKYYWKVVHTKLILYWLHYYDWFNKYIEREGQSRILFWKYIRHCLKILQSVSIVHFKMFKCLNEL